MSTFSLFADVVQKGINKPHTTHDISWGNPLSLRTYLLAHCSSFAGSQRKTAVSPSRIYHSKPLDMLLKTTKALKNNMRQKIQSSCNVRENKKDLRSKNKLVFLVAKTTTYGLK